MQHAECPLDSSHIPSYKATDETRGKRCKLPEAQTWQRVCQALAVCCVWLLSVHCTAHSADVQLLQHLQHALSAPYKGYTATLCNVKYHCCHSMSTTSFLPAFSGSMGIFTADILCLTLPTHAGIITAECAEAAFKRGASSQYLCCPQQVRQVARSAMPCSLPEAPQSVLLRQHAWHL